MAVQPVLRDKPGFVRQSPVLLYVEELLAGLRAHKIRATSDPRSVNPPCVLILPPVYNFDGLNAVTCDFEALVLSPGPANMDAWAVMDRLAADAIEKVLHYVTKMTPASYSPDDAPGYPAYSLEWQATLCWPDRTEEC